MIKKKFLKRSYIRRNDFLNEENACEETVGHSSLRHVKTKQNHINLEFYM
jgi:hypothetical protein